MAQAKPLNGTRTHKLTPVARAALARIAVTPLPRQEINPGLADRLERTALVEVYAAPSPYKTRRGDVRLLRITEAGRQELHNGCS